MTSSRINEGIVQSLQNVMLGTSIWGVLDITYMERRYKIIEIVYELIERDYFKKFGFKLRLIDHNNFVQKIPHYKDNKEFLEENDLLFNGEESYQSYLTHMYKEKIKYEGKV